MDREKIHKMAKLANKLLNNEQIEFYHSKKFLEHIFSNSTVKSIEEIKTRLYLIDTLYATNMCMNPFGIEKIAIELIKFDDDFWRNESIKILAYHTEENKAYQILQNVYGERKAQSLISKYFAFLNQFEFPIYDSLVRKGFNKIVKKLNIKFGDKSPKMVENFDKNFIENLNNFKNYFEIESYEQVDNFFWLFGKISEGSFQLIVNKNVFFPLTPLNFIDVENNKRFLEITKSFNKKKNELQNYLQSVEYYDDLLQSILFDCRRINNDLMHGNNFMTENEKKSKEADFKDFIRFCKEINVA